MGYRNVKKQKKYFCLQIEDFDFSMSRENAYYQFYKNAPQAHALAKKWVLARTETVDSDDGNCPFHPRTNGGQPLKPMVPEPKTMVMVPKKIIESMQ